MIVAKKIKGGTCDCCLDQRDDLILYQYLVGHTKYITLCAKCNDGMSKLSDHNGRKKNFKETFYLDGVLYLDTH